MDYRWIDEKHAEDISKLAICLTEEIIQRTGIPSFDIDLPSSIKLCNEFLAQNKYSVIAAFHDEKIIGFGALCESFSLYADGKFGILQEFYVLPEYRSEKVGHGLLESIKKHAKKNGWKRIELCTPSLPAFDRTVSFYKENGFDRTGGYKMRCLIQ